MGIRSTEAKVLSCHKCGGPIPAGERYFWERRSAEAYHKKCRPAWTNKPRDWKEVIP